jgi:hypothetical protein
MLELGDKHIEMGPQRRKVTLGRDLEADFTVRHGSVSRAHAMIERRRERFVLVDHSSNGSYVSFDDKPEMVVHHEELTLVGQGWQVPVVAPQYQIDEPARPHRAHRHSQVGVDGVARCVGAMAACTAVLIDAPAGMDQAWRCARACQFQAGLAVLPFDGTTAQ